MALVGLSCRGVGGGGSGDADVTVGAARLAARLVDMSLTHGPFFTINVVNHIYLGRCPLSSVL